MPRTNFWSRPVRLVSGGCIAALLAGSTLTAQETENPWAPDRAEPGSVEKIRDYTTAPEYLPRTVAYVPESDRVPSPTDVLGHLAGAPGELSSVAQVHNYFRKLASATDRVRIETIGTSEEGREILLAIVSSAENLAQLDRYRDITNELAEPRRTSAAKMQQ